jgi:hypothetical protein
MQSILQSKDIERQIGLKSKIDKPLANQITCGGGKRLNKIRDERELL